MPLVHVTECKELVLPAPTRGFYVCISIIPSVSSHPALAHYFLENIVICLGPAMVHLAGSHCGQVFTRS